MKEHSAWMLKVIQRARELLEIGWSRDFCAEDARGNPVRFDSERAVAFSLPCALFRAEHDLNIPYARRSKTTQFLAEDLVALNARAKTRKDLIDYCNKAMRDLEKIVQKEMGLRESTEA